MSTMKPKFIFLSIIIVLSLATASTAIVQIVAAEIRSASSLSEIELETEGYIIKACEGYVGVYYGNEEYPAIITEISLDNLREHDRQLVEKGIEVSNRDDLMQVLEDLGS